MKYTADWRSEKYYFFPDDMKKYPDAWCYVVWSRRGPGKTYSALRWAYENKVKMVYMKRTIDDVATICSNSKGIDLSPYVPINRDAGYTIRPQLIRKGLGGFYDHIDEEDNPIGAPFSYIAALNAMKTIKGMDMSDADIMLLDEFIPQAGEITRHAEGEMLLDMYMTIARDREKRGRGHLKLVLFANAENISTPITNELDIVDDMINLTASGRSHLYMEERGIMLHHITSAEIPIQASEMTGIYAGMAGTAWADKAFGGEFSNNDFSAIGHKRLKGFMPMYGYIYKGKKVTIYRKDWEVYVCRASADVEYYDLNRETEAARFYFDHIIDLKDDAIEGHVTFQSYTMYDLIMNYKSYFKI